MKATLTTIWLVSLLALVAVAAPQDRGRDDRRRDDHRGRARGPRDDHGDSFRRSRDRGRDYEGSHNLYRSGGPAISIGIVTPGLSIGYSSGPRGVFRSGYYHYDPYWRDSRFLFRYYAFDYRDRLTAFSPFYYYPAMPGYIGVDKVDFGANSPSFRFDTTIRIRSSRDYDRLDRGLEDAIYDLEDAVEKKDTAAVGRLVPRDYWVDIDPHMGRSYGIRSDDFYDIFNDMAASTRTTEFRVLTAETGRDGARLSFEHDFTDPWGARKVMYQRLTLDARSDGYRIVRFETSRRRF